MVFLGLWGGPWKGEVPDETFYLSTGGAHDWQAVESLCWWAAHTLPVTGQDSWALESLYLTPTPTPAKYANPPGSTV